MVMLLRLVHSSWDKIKEGGDWQQASKKGGERILLFHA